MEPGKRNLQDRMMHLLSEKEKFDVMFVVGLEEKETFGANSLILSAASEVFDKNFYGQFEKPSIEKPLIVEIPDGTPAGFRVLLEYIYWDRAALTGGNVSSVLYLSKKYLLTNLYQQAVHFLVQLISASTVLHILPMSELFEELQERCLEVFDKNAKKLLASKEFLQLSPYLVGRILSRDTLEIDEMTVFKHAVEWAKERIREQGKVATPAAIRAALGNLLYLIRFPTMDSGAFAKGPDATKILTKHECLDIYRWFTLRQSAGQFTTKPRVIPIPPHPCNSHGVYCYYGCTYRSLRPAITHCIRAHPEFIYCPRCSKYVPDYHLKAAE
ncbi:hypothetical protein AAVH_18554 [Aphelenchoides avenae]|nr:hypothetical protein AAVH_30723 [Aphelenchus avenae]KAH7714089.1 hypothetical protein AAVH_18554 [Aphelenchus avenae]